MKTHATALDSDSLFVAAAAIPISQAEFQVFFSRLIPPPPPFRLSLSIAPSLALALDLAVADKTALDAPPETQH